MKNLYVNRYLHPLLIAKNRRRRAPQWVFSLGEPWLLLTPGRLGSLAARLGLSDPRVDKLLLLVRRHSYCPEKFCRRLGIEEVRYWRPEDYPSTLCARCDGVFHQHPEEKEQTCPECLKKAARENNGKPTRAQLKDIMEDRAARQRLVDIHAAALSETSINPYCNMNAHRRIERNWDLALSRVLHGIGYWEVSREFGCSVGLVYKRVKERFWESN